MSPRIRDWGEPRGRPGVLLDRDGTIIEDYHYVGHIERVQLKPGAADAIARFNRAGIPVVIVTNQSGVARGFYPESNVQEVHEYITRELALHDAHVDLFLYSPYHPKASLDDYRDDSHLWNKPYPGMAYQAAKELNLDLHESWVVGDRLTDMEFASRIRASAVFLGADPLPFHMNHFYRFKSLTDAAGLIIERITDMNQSKFPAAQYYGMTSFMHHYSDEITATLNRVSKYEIELAANLLYSAYSEGTCVWIAGNGGAAALADHMATDHAKHMAAVPTMFRQVHSLSANNALSTALANDIGYDAIYSWQLEQFANKDDTLVVFSVSGESRNILRALQCAKEMGMKTITIVGGEAVTIKAASLADAIINIPATNYGVVEDIMSIIQHAIAQYIRQTQMSETEIRSARF